MLRPMPLLMVKAKPNSRVSALTRQDDGTWLAQLKSAPVDGKANAALIDFLADRLGVARGEVTLKSCSFDGATGQIAMDMTVQSPVPGFTLSVPYKATFSYQ